MNLTEYCKELATATTEAIQWIGRNKELVRNEQAPLQRDLRRAGRIFSRCARAAARKMCAGVFGPSQAGKSYLISALARDAKGQLMACFGDEIHDFISEINPEGGRESTGLVTRFTLTRPDSLPPGFPVQLRLLTETDVVKIIANSYFCNCEHREDPQSDVNATLNLLEKRAGQGDPHIDINAMEDLCDYIREFRAQSWVRSLEKTYWNRAIELGPQLSLDDRVRLYALIWDEIPELTELARQLIKSLEALGHANEAFCPVEALIPRNRSIIDVETLKGMDTGQDEPLMIVTADGHQANLPRFIITALTAELTIVMQTSPADYFAHTDLLDFPGYRAHEKFLNVRYDLQRPNTRRTMFLRGKVSYLFQRYCAERELTSMLLCIGPGNQNVKDLPVVINEWICGTHGKDPASRQGKNTSLFFILTKSDMEFTKKAGVSDLKNLWSIRLHSSLLSFFGLQHDWPRNWDGKPFNNLFLLRNPNVSCEIMSYDEQDREVGVSPEKAGRVAEVKESFLNDPQVAEHFRNPQESWEAFMRPNDGGISLIRQSLQPLCNPELKQKQIIQTLNDTRLPLMTRLKAFHKSDDKEEERMQKKRQIFMIHKKLNADQNRQNLGLLLRTLTIEDTEIFDMHDEAARLFRNQAAEETASSAEADAIITDEELADWDPFADEQPAPAASEAAPASKEEKKDEAAFFAAYIESAWVERLHAQAEDPTMQSRFNLSVQEFVSLVNELSTGAARLRLQEAMAEAFREAGRYVTSPDRILRQQAGMAARIINGYVDWLGLNPHGDAAARTVHSEGKSIELFTPPAPVRDFPVLSEERARYADKWFSDWLKAFFVLSMENVNFDGKETINIEENKALSSILKKMENAPEAS